MQRLCYDACPALDSADFPEVAGAEVHCWVNAAREAADDLARTELEQLGWRVLHKLKAELVTEATYAERSEERSYYYSALTHGSHLHVDPTLREYLWRTESEGLVGDDRWAAASYRLFVDGLRRSGQAWAYRFEQQWATGVTADGDDFLPIWDAEQDAREWAAYWAGFSLTRITINQLTDRLALVADNEPLWIAGPRNPECLMTLHPMALREDLLGAP